MARSEKFFGMPSGRHLMDGFHSWAKQNKFDPQKDYGDHIAFGKKTLNNIVLTTLKNTKTLSAKEEQTIRDLLEETRLHLSNLHMAKLYSANAERAKELLAAVDEISLETKRRWTEEIIKRKIGIYSSYDVFMNPSSTLSMRIGTFNQALKDANNAATTLNLADAANISEEDKQYLRQFFEKHHRQAL